MMQLKKDALWIRQALKEGKTLIGSHIFAGSPMLSELISSVGYDLVWVDMEHTPFSGMDVLNNVIAVRAGGAASLVRIPWNDPILAKPILDMGPDILLFPNIRTAEEGRKAIEACEYPPKGIRGYGPQRAAMFGECSQAEYVHNKCRDMIRALQIEDINAVYDLERIADTEGADLFIIGPNDLTGSMGVLGEFHHKEVLDAYDRIAEVFYKKNKPYGVSVGYNPETLKAWKERGAQILFAGYDTGFVRDGARSVFDGMKEIIGG